MPDYDQRCQRLRCLMDQIGCAAILVSSTNNVRYLTGFTGEDSFLLVTDRDQLLITDPRFQLQLQQECSALPVHVRATTEQTFAVACQLIKRRSLKALAVETSTMTVSQWDLLVENFPPDRIIKGQTLVEQLREIKDADEIVAIRRAVDVAERMFACVRAQLSSRQTETDVANELERLVRQLGGSGCSFPPIVAVGARSALPHARASSTLLGSSSFILLDWGATVDGYRSDLTRVLTTSRIAPQFAKVYETVRRAQRAAIEAIKPGISAAQIDRTAREVIESEGMGPHFNHSLGHGIGLEIHEAPRLSPTQDRPLQAGMVVTVEPGIYFPEWGGVRIEDDILVTETGFQQLSSIPTDLENNTIELLG